MGNANRGTTEFRKPNGNPASPGRLEGVSTTRPWYARIATKLLRAARSLLRIRTNHMKTFYVVFVDSNPANVRGFFVDQGEAIAWRDLWYPAGDVQEAKIDKYTRVTNQEIDF
jgi:hypothetical protein